MNFNILTSNYGISIISKIALSRLPLSGSGAYTMQLG